MATADLCEGSRDVAVGDTPQEAVRTALRSLCEPYASEMADGVSDRTWVSSEDSVRKPPEPVAKDALMGWMALLLARGLTV